MGEVINLRQARKARDRSAKQVQAAANRALHGRNKAQRQAEEMEAARLAHLLDGAKIDD
ncbi:DUF4169 family protein [Aquisediminimonas sediminicola]|uniref:DUF4169 family protein n=1 Tax=Alteraquisediminimonas sediminicola TaxID=2676787 RepID=UPI001C8DACD3|nr:DUF4169 family protein [Aquisediminimonas sediminicola]